LQKKTQTERRREDEMRNEEKMNHGGGGWVLYNNFTDGFTERN
jgi:hypothetical protein